MTPEEQALVDAAEALLAAGAAYVASLNGATAHSYKGAGYRIQFAGPELYELQRS